MALDEPDDIESVVLGSFGLLDHIRFLLEVDEMLVQIHAPVDACFEPHEVFLGLFLVAVALVSQHFVDDDQGQLAGALAFACVEKVEIDFAELTQTNYFDFVILFQTRCVSPNQQEFPLLESEERLATPPRVARALELLAENELVELIEYLVLALLLFQR